MRKSITIGTAGHIDHGKTSLVKRLTGVDTDRLKEEKERGMTIELGFAHMKLGDYLISIVDVPGHEKFIKNMVAGAHGIDGVLFVIAADEGVMPQTVEHLTVCRMLGIERGIIVLTKVDMVDEEWLELVEEDVREFLKGSFLEDAPLVKVSSKTGKGFDKLKDEILKLAHSIRERKEVSFPRLPVDRVFSVKGFGTVVTGTLSGGTIKEGDELCVYPSLKKLKVKTVQVAGEQVLEAYPGQRVALNIDLPFKEVERGDIVAPIGFLKGSSLIDAVVNFSENMEPFEKRKRIHFHYLTQMVEGEIILIDRDVAEPSSTAKVQIVLDKEIFPVYGDRFVLRTITPSRVIGGGVILHPLEEKRFRKKFKDEFIEKIKRLERGKEEAAVVFVSQFEPLPLRELPQLLDISPDSVDRFVKRIEERGKIVRAGNYLYLKATVDEVFSRALSIISDFHKKYPVLKGINRETLKSLLKVDDSLFEKIVQESESITVVSQYVKFKEFEPYLDEKFKALKDKVDAVLLKEGFSPPTVERLREKVGDIRENFYALLEFLQSKGYKMTGDYLLHPDIFSRIVEKVMDFKKEGTFTVSQFKELLSVSRKYAIPFLELLDREGITERESDGTRRLKL